MTFNWNAFRSGKFAVNCRTEEAANRFMVECENHGIKWFNGDAATEHTFWYRYQSEVTYLFLVRGLTHGDTAWHKNRGRSVVEFAC